MEGFFNARSLVVAGVSNSPGNLAQNIVRNLIEFQYKGYFYLVGPKGGAFLGHKIYRSIAELPESVDLAAILVPAEAVPEVLRQCGEKGITRVVVESGGFRELGEERLEIEEKVQTILKQYGIRMIGPNGLGIINSSNGLSIPFMTFRSQKFSGPVGIVSQSGGVGAMLINLTGAENIGFSKFASIGNKLNVDESDLLEYLVRDVETDAIFCYLEGIADGRRLMEIGASSRKPILLQKSNRWKSGSVIAKSHSASLSGDDRVLDAALKQSGIIRVREQHETAECLKAFFLPQMKGNRLAIVSRSGGHAVIAADASEEHGFELPPLSMDLIELVRSRSRARVIQLHNPLDLGDLFDFDLYLLLARNMLAGNEIDGIVFIHHYQGTFDASDSRRVIKELAALNAEYQKPLALCVFTDGSELYRDKEMITFPLFDDPVEAVRALARNRDRLLLRPVAFSTERPGGVDMLGAHSRIMNVPDGLVPPENLASILSAYGIPAIPWGIAKSENEAVRAAARLGFPVVLKTANPEAIHKSDVGGVLLGLTDAASVADAYHRLRRIGPSVLVQKMASAGMEWLVGGKQDRDLGPVLIAGPGGIYVETLKDTGIRIAPIACEEAHRLLDDLRGTALLGGVRGQPPLDRTSLVDLMVRTSWLLADFPVIRELDLNPVCVFEEGCAVLDWRAVKGAGNPMAG